MVPLGLVVGVSIAPFVLRVSFGDPFMTMGMNNGEFGNVGSWSAVSHSSELSDPESVSA